MAESAEQKRRLIDPVTGAPKESSSGSATETGPKAEKEKQGDSGKHGKGQGNLDGRNPGQPQTSASNQDSSENRPDMGIVDPMTSRMPGKERKNDHDR